MVDDSASADTAAGAPRGGGGQESSAELSRRLVREAWKATLSTLDREKGFPYGSLVAVAAAADGSPLLLLSGLAEHSKNLAADNRASLLFDGSGMGRGALTGARVTLVGRISDATTQGERARYLARHPDAAQFIDFGDFRLLKLEVAWAHMVAGFGRIVRLDAASLVVPSDDATEVAAAEEGILGHMNEDHTEALTLLAANEIARRGGQLLLGAPWQMIGCDPSGFDMTDGVVGLRISFPQRVTTLDGVRKALIIMVDAARGRGEM